MIKKNFIITFDLHEVIFAFDYKKVARILWQSRCKLAIITTLLRIPLIVALVKMILRDATDEEFYQVFEKRRPILLPLIIDMTNAQKIIPGMDRLIQELKTRGYQLHVCSNIGPRRFQQLCIDFPHIMNQFEKVKIVQHSTHTIIKKPDTQFFRDYLDQCAKPKQPVVFIDDKKENIKAAQSLGIQGIRFTSSQNLRQQLQNADIL